MGGFSGISGVWSRLEALLAELGNEDGLFPGRRIFPGFWAGWVRLA